MEPQIRGCDKPDGEAGSQLSGRHCCFKDESLLGTAPRARLAWCLGGYTSRNLVNNAGNERPSGRGGLYGSCDETARLFHSVSSRRLGSGASAWCGLMRGRHLVLGHSWLR